MFKNIPFWSMVLFITIITVIVLCVDSKINNYLQNIEGPVRKVVYIPKDNKSNGAWIIIDSSRSSIGNMVANFHGIGDIVKKKENNNSFNRSVIFKQEDQYFFLALISSGNLVVLDGYNANTKKFEPYAKILSNKNRIITVLIPVNANDSIPDIKIHKNHTIINSNGIRMYYCLTDSMYSKINCTELETDAEECLLVLKDTNEIIKSKTNYCVFLQNASYAFWAGDTILNLHKTTHNSTMLKKTGIISKNKWFPIQKTTRQSIKMNKNKDLTSIFPNPLGEYGDGSGYTWKCNENRLNKWYAKHGNNMNLFFAEGFFNKNNQSNTKFRSMIKKYKKLTKNLLPPDKYNPLMRSSLTAYAAVVARLDNNEKLKNWVIKSLSMLHTIKEYDQLLDRGNTVWWFCTAYDIISPLLIETEKKKIRFELEQHARPIATHFNFVATNNWRNRIGVALGLAGLLLQKSEWVELIVNHFDHYLDYAFKEGICYEGNTYFDFGFGYIAAFCFFLSNIDNGIINFFEDERYQQIICSLIAQLAPSGQFPCFEDCNQKTYLNELISVSSRPFYQLALKNNDKDLLLLSKVCSWVELTRIQNNDYFWLPDASLYALPVPKPISPKPEYLQKWLPHKNNNNVDIVDSCRHKFQFKN